MNTEELKKQLLTGTFYYYKSGLWIQSKVNGAVIIENDYLMVSFEGGHADAFLKNVKPIRRPGNIVRKFNWCYILKNDENECIGYIGEIENDK